MPSQRCVTGYGSGGYSLARLWSSNLPVLPATSPPPSRSDLDHQLSTTSWAEPRRVDLTRSPAFVGTPMCQPISTSRAELDLGHSAGQSQCRAVTVQGSHSA